MKPLIVFNNIFLMPFVRASYCIAERDTFREITWLDSSLKQFDRRELSAAYPQSKNEESLVNKGLDAHEFTGVKISLVPVVRFKENPPG